MSQDTIRVASTAPMSIRISEPHPDPARPGDSPELKSAVIAGGAGETVTEGVNAQLFHDWMKANASHSIVVNGLFREIKDDDELAGEVEYGFEPALERIAKEAEGDAKDGSLEGDKPAAHVDMDAHSDVPNDDSPRSQTETGPAFVAPAAAPEPGLASGQTAPAAPARPVDPPHTIERQPFNHEVAPEHREAANNGNTPIGSGLSKG